MNDSRAVYLDTSVLAKWYIAEPDSEQASADGKVRPGPAPGDR
ncbi:MAG: hypothetical protein ACU837_03910 [Gammaproteobacteria bacterium]